MVVHEIKNPMPAQPTKLVPEERELDPVFAASAIARVKRFKQEMEKNREFERRRQGRRPLTPETHRTVREMVEHVNANLEKNGILVHLVLSKNEEGYAVDVYDCTNNQVCEVIRDIYIDLDDLPSLIRKLQQETGFIVDTVS